MRAVQKVSGHVIWNRRIYGWSFYGEPSYIQVSKQSLYFKKVYVGVKSRSVLLTEQFFQSVTHSRNRKLESQFLPFPTLSPRGVLATPCPTLTGLATPTFQWSGHTSWGPTQHPKLEGFCFPHEICLHRAPQYQYCLETLPKIELQRPKAVPPRRRRNWMFRTGWGVRWATSRRTAWMRGMWHGEPSRTHQERVVTDSLVTSVYIIMEFRIPRQDPTSCQRRKQVTHKGIGIKMVSDFSTSRS